MKLEILKTLNAERAARRSAVVVTDVATGGQRLVKAAEGARDPLKEQIEKHIRRGKSGMGGNPAGKRFFAGARPPPPPVITRARDNQPAPAPRAAPLGHD